MLSLSFCKILDVVESREKWHNKWVALPTIELDKSRVDEWLEKRGQWTKRKKFSPFVKIIKGELFLFVYLLGQGPDNKLVSDRITISDLGEMLPPTNEYN